MVIHIRDLKKTYPASAKAPAKEALKGVSLDVPAGSIFGLLGPNGAGKSTLINIMAGLVIKTSGIVRLCQYDIDENPRLSRSVIGVVPQELVVDTFFTVREALDMHAGYYGLSKEKRRTQAIIDAVGLTEQADIHTRRLSGGMKRRLLVAKALVHSPPILVLDEPTAGVDVALREQLWDYVRKLNREEGVTVVLTTHYLEEADELCDRVAIINRGEVVAHDTKQALLRGFEHKQIVFTLSQPLAEVPEALKGLNATLEEGALHVRYDPAQCGVGDIMERVVAAGLAIRDISTAEPKLEDVFRQMTKT
jgi:ABC-2 type transport system ATP-binding protein